VKLNNIDLNKLNVFLSVVENKGVSRSAESLLLTRSAVSQNISSLERSLDLKLFNRIGKVLTLTQEGKVLYREFRAYQDMLNHTLNSISKQKGVIQGLIRVGTFQEFAKQELSPVITQLLENNSKVQVKLLFSSPTELNKLLVGNKIDLAFSIYPHPDTKAVTSTRLFEEELILVAGKKFYRERMTLPEILELPFVDYYQNSILARRWITHHYKKRVPELNIVAYAATSDVVLNLIAQGAGIGVVPKYLATEMIQEKKVFAISPGRNPLKDYLWLLELRNSSKSPALTLFKEIALRQLS